MDRMREGFLTSQPTSSKIDIKNTDFCTFLILSDSTEIGRLYLKDLKVTILSFGDHDNFTELLSKYAKLK
jgi:hypothetical protein